MIPQNCKDIVASVRNAGIYQSLALVLFLLVFVGIVMLVFNKPKKHYNDMENAPLDNDSNNNLI